MRMKPGKHPAALILLIGLIVVGVLGVAAYPTLRRLIDAQPNLSVMGVLADLPPPPPSPPAPDPSVPPPASLSWSAEEALALRELVWTEAYDSLEHVLLRARELPRRSGIRAARHGLGAQYERAAVAGDERNARQRADRHARSAAPRSHRAYRSQPRLRRVVLPLQLDSLDA
jgi:hypothetical protein